MARLAFQRPDCSLLRREMGGKWRHLSGSLAVVREEGDRAIAGERGRATAGSWVFVRMREMLCTFQLRSCHKTAVLPAPALAVGWTAS